MDDQIELKFKFDKFDELQKNPLQICVVGHTNHGKTSTIRTLAEDASFGTVDCIPGATRNIERTRVTSNGKSLFHVTDTPGFEVLDERLQELRESNGTAPGQREIDALINRLDGRRSENDMRLLRTLQAIKSSHIIIQVLDVREDPTDPQYHDEIEFLQRCGVPLIMTLNFVNHKHAKLEEWKNYLREIGLHTYTVFDAYTRKWEDEHALFRKMETLVPEPLHQEFLSAWVDYRKNFLEDATWRAAKITADLIRNVAAYRQPYKAVSKKEFQAKRKEYKACFERDVTEKKDEAIGNILKRFKFDFRDIENWTDRAESSDVIFQIKLFENSALKWGAATAGAAAGLGVDMMLVGGTFGIPTVLGAIGGWLTASGIEHRNVDAYGRMWIGPTKDLLFLLGGMCISLIRALRTRGRADPHHIDVRYDRKALNPNSEFAKHIVALYEGTPVDDAVLRKSIVDAINDQ